MALIRPLVQIFPSLFLPENVPTILASTDHIQPQDEWNGQVGLEPASSELVGRGDVNHFMLMSLFTPAFSHHPSRQPRLP